MLARSCLAIAAVCVSLAACVSGADPDSTNPNSTKIPKVVVLAGNAVALQFPFFQGGNFTGQFPQLQVQAFDSQAFMTNATTASNHIGSVAPVSDSNCLRGGCAWVMLTDTNDLTAPFGIMTYVADGTGAATLVDAAYTTSVSNAALAAEEPNRPITNVVTFGLSSAALTTAATAVALSAQEAITQGMLVGMVVGRQSAASPTYHQLPPPAKGATVTMTTNATAVLYSVDDAYSSGNPTGSTSVVTNSDGIFFAVNPAATGSRPQQLNFTVKGTGNTWATQTTAVVPGKITLSIFYAT